MRVSIFIFLIFFTAAGILAQQNHDNLAGYWMERETDNEFSLSTLLVFDINIDGRLEGRVYFMDSEDSNRSFALDRIKIDDNKFSFQIESTTISFFGELNEAGHISNGTFMLDSENSFEVSHQKLTGSNLKDIIGLPDMKKRIIRRHVDSDDGLMTG